MAEAMQVVVPQPVQLRAVETFIKDYKRLEPEDIRNMSRENYDDFKKRFLSDPVKVMIEAADLGMDLSQYGNLISPDTRLQQQRSIVHRLMELSLIHI